MLSSDSRQNILSSFTLDAQLSFLSGSSFWTLVPPPPLPSLRFADGPHGVRRYISDSSGFHSFRAVCFPPACALACSWNEDLVQQVGHAIAEECQQVFNVNVLLGPAMNIKRHPCGGRNFEYFSEDPIVTARIATAMIKGIQGSGQVGACVKHVCVNNQEAWRMRLNVVVDERTLRELYLAAFQYVVHVDQSVQPWAVMTAYNQLNGVFCSENEWLWTQLFRKQWAYKGIVITDWGATNLRVAGVHAGVDLEMPASFGIHNAIIKNALKDQTLSRQRFEDVVYRNISFIRKATQATTHTNPNDGKPADKHQYHASGVQLFDDHHQLAYRAALECIVLLQNKNQILPLRSSSNQVGKTVKIALIGDFCQDPRYQGMGSSKVNATKVDTVLQFISLYTDHFVFSRGYDNCKDDREDETQDSKDYKESLINQAVHVAQKAEVVLIFTGLPEIYESEGFDRTHLDIPSHHNDLVQRITKVNANVVVVLSNGAPVLMPWKDNVKAIVEGNLLGQAGARAMLDVLFGHYSPSGKLVESFPLALEYVPSNPYFPGTSLTVEYREGLNVGYRYYDTAKVPVLFPFGYGLSYTTFSYHDCSCTILKQSPIPSSLYKSNALVQVACTVLNSGSYPGAEIVQIYIHHDNRSLDKGVYHPEHQLKGFFKTKVLQPGDKESVIVHLTAEAFAFYDIGLSDWILEEGAKYEIQIAASSRDIRWTGVIESSLLPMSNLGKFRILQPSKKALDSQPRIVPGNDDSNSTSILSHPLRVDDQTFSAMMARDLSEIKLLSIKSLLGRFPLETSTSTEQEYQHLYHDVALIHRNSLLEEVEQSGLLGRLFTKLIIKLVERDLENPSDLRQRKVARAFAINTPIRGLAQFSRGLLDFHMVDFLIALFNGHCMTALRHLWASLRYKLASQFKRR